MGGHIPDLELSLFAHDPESIARDRRTEIERHSASCAECGASLDFYSVAEEDLHDPTVWQPIGVTTATLMSAYANRCAAEDAEADELLAPYFEKPAKAAWATLGRRREFHTGGVVRRLNARAHAIVASEPMAALTFADLAQVVASVLPDDTYPNNAVYELRGTAWKERANALLRLGELNEALESLRRAERAYGHLGSSGSGLAAVELVRAAVYFQMSELAKAEYHAGRAAQEYAHLGQRHRGMKALLLRGEIKYEAQQLDESIDIFRQVIDYGEMLNDPQWIAKGAYTLALCELERGKLGEAAILFTKALVILRETGPVSERVSTEWGLARVVLHGNASEAARRLREVIAAFEQIGMVTDAALASLDMADALFVLGRVEQIEKVAVHAFRVLKKAGVVTGALTALAYLKEAAASRRLSPELIHGIRTFVLLIANQGRRRAYAKCVYEGAVRRSVSCCVGIFGSASLGRGSSADRSAASTHAATGRRGVSGTSAATGWDDVRQAYSAPGGNHDPETDRPAGWCVRTGLDTAAGRCPYSAASRRRVGWAYPATGWADDTAPHPSSGRYLDAGTDSGASRCDGPETDHAAGGRRPELLRAVDALATRTDQSADRVARSGVTAASAG